MQRALWQIFLQFAVSKRGATLIQAKHKKANGYAFAGFLSKTVGGYPEGRQG